MNAVGDDHDIGLDRCAILETADGYRRAFVDATSRMS
jgi:hypothetical protein